MGSNASAVLIPPVPHGYDAVCETFGDIEQYIGDDGTLSPSWEAQKIVRLALPGPLRLAGTTDTVISRITVHKLISGSLHDALQEIFSGGHWSELVSYGGGFNFRPQRGSSNISMHSFGIAWDFDPDHNTLGSTDGAMAPEVVDIFEQHGFFWGGHFSSRKDPMHFQYATGV